REQALEKTAEELKHKAQELEAKVRSLQTENEWLRGLVVVRDSSSKAGVVREEKEKVKEEGRKGVGTTTTTTTAGDEMEGKASGDAEVGV
ncbi:MAG: hypothetical protein Q9164_004219, partial [Protoblastenia rupestris]